jgi:hypothetical protein
LNQQTVYIYGLTEPGSDLIRYVGYAKNLNGRFRSHLTEAAKKGGTHKRHWLRKLLDAGQLPGIVKIEETTKGLCQERERYWIKNLKLTNDLVNSTAGGDGIIDPPPYVLAKMLEASLRYNGSRTKQPAQGLIHTEETRKQISERLRSSETWHKNHAKAMEQKRGVPKSPEHRAKIGAGNSGKVRTPEMRARMSESNKGKNNWLGRHHTAEARAKIAASKVGKTPWLGKRHTEEAKRKMSAARKGKPLSEETRAKLSAARMGNQNLLGHVHTPETRAAISAALNGSEKFKAAMAASGLKQKGVPKSPEHRAAIKAAHVARAERIRRERLSQQEAAA